MSVISKTHKPVLNGHKGYRIRRFRESESSRINKSISAVIKELVPVQAPRLRKPEIRRWRCSGSRRSVPNERSRAMKGNLQIGWNERCQIYREILKLWFRYPKHISRSWRQCYIDFKIFIVQKIFSKVQLITIL